MFLNDPGILNIWSRFIILISFGIGIRVTGPLELLYSVNEIFRSNTRVECYPFHLFLIEISVSLHPMIPLKYIFLLTHESCQGADYSVKRVRHVSEQKTEDIRGHSYLFWSSGYIGNPAEAAFSEYSKRPRFASRKVRAQARAS